MPAGDIFRAGIGWDGLATEPFGAAYLIINCGHGRLLLWESRRFTALALVKSQACAR